MSRRSNKFFIVFLLCTFIRHAYQESSCSKPTWFLCDNKRCISTLFTCDGEDDCGDRSDEMNCRNPPSDVMATISCAEDEYRCKDETCIPLEKFCDNVHDCSDMSDEYFGCVKDIKCDGFRCKDGHCIKHAFVCDGMPDCLDGSDEESGCEYTYVVPQNCTNEFNRYLCKNGHCISLNMTCNGVDDCTDGSDEDIDGCAKAEKMCKDASTCDHFCRSTPKGQVCSCRPGYKLLDNHTCTDIDECIDYGICDQHCLNNNGSYNCICLAGYTLQEDKRSCKAEGGEALMVFSTTSHIRGFYLESEVYFPVVRDLHHVVGVSVDVDYVYWSDVKNQEQGIFRSLEDGSMKEVIVSAGLGSPEDIAVDWVTNNLYFTDSLYKHIAVCSRLGNYCTVLITERADKPRGIALVPSAGVMYWSDWGSMPHISRASMDGKDSVPFITENLSWPNGLAVDYPNDRLYWVDGKLRIIESVRFDGSDRRTILHDTAKRPYSLAIFENKLYWSDWSTNTIQTCDKLTGKDWKIIIREGTSVYGIHIYHSVLKPKLPNPCNLDPCSQLCLLNSKGSYTCACTLDAQLADDGHTCKVDKDKKHLVIIAGNTFIDYYHEILGKPKMLSSITLRHITAVAYNSESNEVIATDLLTNSIFRFNTNTGHEEQLLSVKNEIIGGMDFDYMGNNLYWSDMERRTIEIHSLQTQEKTVISFQDIPLAISLVPEEGIVLVVFRSGDMYRIEGIQLKMINTEAKTVTIADNLLGPTVSVRYNHDLKKVFWADQGSGRIESSSIDGSNRFLFRTGLSAPVSLAILGEVVFWTELGSNQLHWAENHEDYQTNKHTTLAVPENIDMMYLLPMDPLPIVKQHPCRVNNGNCSHVCLAVDSVSYHCTCPPGMRLAEDQRKCVKVSTCGDGEVQCGELHVCVKQEQLCNGFVDCPNGEDEGIDCLRLNISCGGNEFACKISGECVSLSKRCNSHFDCKDRTDEEDCHEPANCKDDEFRCHEGECISNYLVCDGHNHCSDFSDELNCALHTCDLNAVACDSGKCIPKPWHCDGDVDCEDGSDEGEKCRVNQCPEQGMFACQNGRCVDKSLVCNAIDDCGDHTDEQNCPEGRAQVSVECQKDEYRCANTGTCLPKEFKCNGVQDCPANDDEHNCPRCELDEFTCGNGKCIPLMWMCDNYDDCGDKSDERDCGSHLSSRYNNQETKNNTSQRLCKDFQCSSGTCLSYSRVCDGLRDCLDGSDEFGECTISCIKNNPCQHVCHRTPAGPVCSCQKGYRLKSDKTSCEDVDECQDNPCSQICQNKPGSFVCSCYQGYVLRGDKISCKATGSPMKIVTASENDIRRITKSLSAIEVVYQEPNFDVSGLDVNAEREAIYWSSSDLGTINVINMTTKERKTVSGIGRPETLAVDWITDNVYFYDTEHPCAIKVCNLQERKCAKIIEVEGAQVRVMAIAVDPNRGSLFWSQTNWRMYESPSSEVYRADMIGSKTAILAHQNLGVVSGLAIDHVRSHLYWTDTLLRVIERSELDGKNRQVFMKTENYQPLGINIYEDSLYWLMGSTGSLKKCNIHGNRSCEAFSLGSTNVNRYFAIVHASRQPFARNNCQEHKCPHLCVPKYSDYACICPDGYPASKSNGMCPENSNEKVKFISSGTQISEETGQRGTSSIAGIVITIITCMIIIFCYYYYQQIKVNASKKNDLSIHFQNPSFGRKNDLEASMNCAGPVLLPGEHEYVNPTSSISAKIDLQHDSQSKTVQLTNYSELPESEMDTPNSRQDVRLIS